MSAKGKAISKGRLGRTIRSLAVMVALGVVLAVTNVILTRRDISLATGEHGPAQRDFLVNAAERPDIATFFKKNLSADQRLAMAHNIGQYDDPKLAKLCGILLGDFDPVAREELTKSLSLLAAKRPLAVAGQLIQKGSFQQIAVSRALSSVGAPIWPVVVQQFSIPDAKLNAVNYLVSVGPKTVPPILTALGDKTLEVRLAAADALGKLKAKEAVPALLKLYETSVGDEQYGYLAALSGIGDQISAPLMSSTLQDSSVTIPRRALAALGLGRVGGPQSVKVLWQFAESEDQQLRQSVISALQLTQDDAFHQPGTFPATKLEVARGVKTEISDRIVSDSLKDFTLRLAAAEIAKRRPRLVANLTQLLNTLNPNSEGDFADQLVSALLSTPQGTKSLGNLRNRAELAGIIERRTQLDNSSSKTG